MAQANQKVKMALIQLSVVKNKEKNNSHAEQTVRRVVAEFKPRIVILPECFNCPYGNEFFAEYSEPVPNGHTCQLLSKLAKELNVYIIGGSIIEIDNQKKLYNTCTVWDPKGNLIGKHRKIHLFDIDLENRYFRESATLTPGSELTVVTIDNRKYGIAICHDIRFAELAHLYRKEGCEMIVYPCAFDVVQGPPHWEVLQKARANDNQVFVATISTARDETAAYVAYGHTMVVDPWANVLYEASEKEEVIIADIDFSKVTNVRRQIPIFNQRRTDLYDIVKK